MKIFFKKLVTNIINLFRFTKRKTNKKVINPLNVEAERIINIMNHKKVKSIYLDRPQYLNEKLMEGRKFINSNINNKKAPYFYDLEVVKKHNNSKRIKFKTFKELIHEDFKKANDILKNVEMELSKR